MRVLVSREELEVVPLAFPETPRVVYEKNVLEEVKCQIRFPPILSIDSSPATFQEAVRGEFPYFEMKTSVKLPAGVPAGLTQVFERDLSLGGKSYCFISEDRKLTVALSRNDISLTSRGYERWEPFQAQLLRVLNSLADVYRPSFFTHTCVRYKNSIRRGPLGLAEMPWSMLLQPWISGMLDKPDIATVEAQQGRCVIKLEDGIGRVDATCSLGVHQPSKEQVFLIEAHVFDDSKKELTDVLPRLDALHRQAGLFFHWCITDELHRAMLPTPV